MKIGVDVDNVLAEFTESFLQFHNAAYGTSLRIEECDDFWFRNNFGWTREEELEKICEFYKSTEFRCMDPVDFSVEGVSELKRHHELVVVTARHKEVMNETTGWVGRYFPSMFSEVHFAHSYGNGSKSEDCRRLGVDVLIEDSLENARDFALAGGEALLLDQRWNRTGYLPSKVKRMYSWKEVSFLCR